MVALPDYTDSYLLHEVDDAVPVVVSQVPGVEVSLAVQETLLEPEISRGKLRSFDTEFALQVGPGHRAGRDPVDDLE